MVYVNNILIIHFFIALKQAKSLIVKLYAVDCTVTVRYNI